MCSELFRIPTELSGVPLLGFGVLLLAWLVGWAVLLARHAAKQGVDADFWGYLQPAVIGALAMIIAPRFAPAGIPIRGYGVMLLVAITTGVGMAVHRARKHGISPDTIYGLVFWLFVAGIAGARAFFVIEYWEAGRFARDTILETIFAVLQFTEGGLVIYGAVIGGLLAFIVFALRNKLPVLGMADILAPCFMVGLAIGRIGCLLNGCCYGGVCELPWAVTFPADSPPHSDQLVHGQLHGLHLVEGDDGYVSVIRDGEPVGPIVAANDQPIATPGVGAFVERPYELDGEIQKFQVTSMVALADTIGAAYQAEQPLELRLADGETIKAPAAPEGRSLPVHPTQIYSTINAALTAWLLWNWFPYRRRDGEIALAMFTLYPISRFLLEIIRTDEDAIFGTGLSISQNVSVGVLALATVGWAVLLLCPPGRQLREVADDSATSQRTSPASAA